MPRSQSGAKRPLVSADDMKKAVDAVTTDNQAQRMTYQQACDLYGVKKSTLIGQVKKFRNSDASENNYKPNFANKRVFTDEEFSLVNYIEKIAKMNYGPTKKGVR